LNYKDQLLGPTDAEEVRESIKCLNFSASVLSCDSVVTSKTGEGTESV